MKFGLSPRFDFNRRPYLVIWETTRSCDLACIHCRASAEPFADPHELSTEEAKKLIRDVRQMRTPIFIFSGGDPLKRPDLPELVRYARECRLRTGAIPAVTPLLTEERLLELKEAGLDQVAFSLDGATAQSHEKLRGVAGVFEKTLEAVRTAKRLGLAVQINSLVNVHNAPELEDLIRLVESLGIVFWEVFFLVPVGRGRELSLLSAAQFEGAFEKIVEVARRAPFVVKVTEAPHYRRFYFEKIKSDNARLSAGRAPEHQNTRAPEQAGRHTPGNVNAGKGFLFVSCRGEVMPSGFLPIAAGNVRESSLGELYRLSPLFQQLRQPSLLKGRCGLCDYRELCGGSRARAYAMTGDPFAEDPACAYETSHR